MSVTSLAAACRPQCSGQTLPPLITVGNPSIDGEGNYVYNLVYPRGCYSVMFYVNSPTPSDASEVFFNVNNGGAIGSTLTLFLRNGYTEGEESNELSVNFPEANTYIQQCGTGGTNTTVDGGGRLVFTLTWDGEYWVHTYDNC